MLLNKDQFRFGCDTVHNVYYTYMCFLWWISRFFSIFFSKDQKYLQFLVFAIYIFFCIYRFFVNFFVLTGLTVIFFKYTRFCVHAVYIYKHLLFFCEYPIIFAYVYLFVSIRKFAKPICVFLIRISYSCSRIALWINSYSHLRISPISGQGAVTPVVQPVGKSSAIR